MEGGVNQWGCIWTFLRLSISFFWTELAGQAMGVVVELPPYLRSDALFLHIIPLREIKGSWFS